MRGANRPPSTTTGRGNSFAVCGRLGDSSARDRMLPARGAKQNLFCFAQFGRGAARA